MPVQSPVLLMPVKRTFFKDAIERANSATVPGNDWIALVGTWGVSDGKLYSVSDANDNICWRSIGRVNGRVSWTPQQHYVAANYRIANLLIRGINSTNYLMFRVYGTTAELLKRDAGAYSVLATVVVTSPANATDYVLQALLRGNDVTCRLDGVDLFTHTLAGGNTKYAAADALFAGAVVSKAGAPTGPVRWDNFRVSE
jgi:hypothetical protein